MKDALAYRQEQLCHLDATINLLDPDFKVETIPPKRARRVKLFRAGELGRVIRDALREGGRPLTVAEIAASIIRTQGLGEDVLRAILPRVRGNLSFLRRSGRVMKEGERLMATWTLKAAE